MLKEKEITIVVADDNPSIRESLKDILLEQEYKVITVGDGYELLALLKEISPSLIILDLIMPEKGGTDIIFSIRSISPDTKIIIHTGFKKYKNSIYADTADKFILKGGSPEKILQAIESLMIDR